MSFQQLTHIKTDLPAMSLNFSITSKTLPNKPGPFRKGMRLHVHVPTRAKVCRRVINHSRK